MTKEALRLALKALEIGLPLIEDFGSTKQLNAQHKAITAIYEALAEPEHGWTPERIAGMARLKEAQDKKLAQPEQEYHAVNAIHKGQQCYVKTQTEQPKVRTGNCLRVGVCASEGHKIAPQRTWVGLTDEERKDTLQSVNTGFVVDASVVALAIEAKLKEKNA